MRKNIKQEYQVDLIIYDTQKEMLDDCKLKNKEDKDIEGAFIPARGNSKYIGSIHLNKEQLNIENIIHEASHAAIEVNRHIRKCRLAVHEEKIVYAIGQLASLLIEDILFAKEEKC